MFSKIQKILTDFLKTLKGKTQYSIFLLIDIFIASIYGDSNKVKTLIVIRTDAIGDYILFRNFLKPLYEKYGKLTLVGNIAYQELALKLDKEYLQEFIPVDRKKFARNIFYRFKMIKKLRESSYATLINPIYSRDRVSEDIVRIIDAQEKIASIGNDSNLPQKLKERYDKNYTTLLPVKNEVIFEFYRNLEFFRHLISPVLEVDFCINIQNPQEAIDAFNLSSPYAVLFIGASAQFRKWSNNNFLKVANFLYSQYGDNIVICGGSEDFTNGEYIKTELQKSSIPCSNLCGKTSLLDLARVVYNGNHLISNETSCVHIAKAIRHDKVFVVSNGNHLHRFTPYPKEIGGEYYGIFHPFIQANLDEYVFLSNYSGQISDLDINEITAESVIEKIKECEYNLGNNQR